MMKTLYLALAGILLAPLPALAQTATGTGTANSSSNSGAVAVGGSGSVIINGGGSTQSRIRQTGSLKTTPNAIAPGLGSAAIETCYGPGVTAGVAVTGFGISGGMGQWDTSCNRRLNARTIYAFGFKRQALSIMLNEPEVANAFGMGGPVPAGYRRAAPVGYRGEVVSGCQKWRDGVVGSLCLY